MKINGTERIQDQIHNKKIKQLQIYWIKLPHTELNDV